MSKTDRVLAILRQRYPCEALPYGAMTEIADEVGCSRELVRRVAFKESYGKLDTAPVVLCSECDEPLAYEAARRAALGEGTGRHLKCIPMVTVQCTYCGNDITRSLSQIAHRYKGSAQKARRRQGVNTTDMYFCDKTCQGRWLGKRPRKSV